jgi:ABC-2 type transport system ATP-binding protein
MMAAPPKPPSGEAVVTVDAVEKSFGPVRAVAGISLAVPAGEMFGIIGPDGAGKTTLLRLVCGLIRADRGEIRVLGANPFRERRAAAGAIGYLSQRFSLYGDLTIDENIEFFARIHGVRDFRAGRDRLLDLTGLTRFRARYADRLSGGMKQKLALACTLIHQPPILVLDEPTTGVDPVSRREFWKLLAEFLNQGLTILFATPYLDEAERCHRVALIAAGRVLALDRPAVLQAAGHGVLIEVLVSPARAALDVARRHAGADRVQLFGERLHVKAEAASDGTALEHALGAAGLRVDGWRVIPPSLEDVYIDRLAAADRGAAAEQTAKEQRS